MSKYLITGGEGFIGGRIVELIGGNSYDIKSGLDILNEKQLIQATEKVKGIFHCAAKISVPESFLKIDNYRMTNVDGTNSVSKIAEQINAKIVFSSSAAVYGESDKSVNEDCNTNPQSPYAQNKVDGENILKKSMMPNIALRYFNVYGPGQSPQYAGVITSFILNALRDKDLVINGDENLVRDFVFVDDVARANIAAMEYDNKKFEAFNIGSGVETSILELAETIIKVSNSKSKIVRGPSRAGDIIYSNADVSKAKNLLNWSAKVSLGEGLMQTVKYYKENSR